MNIKWFGHSCFMLTSENGTKVLVDPYKDMLGYKLPQNLTANIVTTSHDHIDHNCISAVKNDFIHINTIGDFCEHGISIRGVDTFHDNESGTKKGKNIVYTYYMDGMNICHCGDLGHTLDLKTIEDIGNVDILLLPVGGGFTLDISDAVHVMNQLKPKVIIPMHYRTRALGVLGLKFNKVETFIKASGLVSIKYSELNMKSETLGDHAKIIVLKYE